MREARCKERGGPYCFYELLEALQFLVKFAFEARSLELRVNTYHWLVNSDQPVRQRRTTQFNVLEY